MKHTKEPWEAYQDGKREMNNINHFIKSEAGDLVSYGHLSESDAKRIVACVNACQGIPTEPLEVGGLGALLSLGLEEQERGDVAEKQRDELMAELNGIKQNIAFAATCNLVARMEQAEKQRDELLAALESVQKMLAETHQQITAKANNNPYFVKSSTLEMFAIELEEPIMCCGQVVASVNGGA